MVLSFPLSFAYYTGRLKLSPSCIRARLRPHLSIGACQAWLQALLLLGVDGDGVRGSRRDAKDFDAAADDHRIQGESGSISGRKGY